MRSIPVKEISCPASLVWQYENTVAFKDFPEQEQGITLLQRSLGRGRLGHAYLFAGHELDGLENIARTLAKVLNCRQPRRNRAGIPVDCCDGCPNCRRIDAGNHPDVHWVRPESKSRVVTIDQTRELIEQVNLKPSEAESKMAIVVAADRLNVQAANAFLKTLEEPPSRSVIVLLSTEPQRLLETIRSRCLRLNFAAEGPRPLESNEREWLSRFAELAAAEQKSLLRRYQLMDVLLQRLSEIKTGIEAHLTARSPLENHEEIEKDLKERWEDELAAAVEAEYRRRRAELLLILERWLRDVWLRSLSLAPALLEFHDWDSVARVAERITPHQALENLQTIQAAQRLLYTNVQEALALEVGLLKLSL